jgi:hypothetical protein
MLDLIGTTILTAAVALDLNATVANLPMSAAQKLAAVTLAGLWIGAAVAVAATGILADTTTPVPVIGVMVALPLVAASVAALGSARVRAALLALPLRLLVGLNILRSIGAFFLLLALQDRLSGPFPQSAGWGDVITGLAAIPLTLAIIRDAHGDDLLKVHRGWLLAWNVFGALDLVAALTFGVMSAPGSPLQVFGGAVGSTAIVTLPWSTVPTVLVPFYLILHGIIFARLAQAGRLALATA